MDSRFLFLEDDCPKLAEYGRRAEECISSDPNICLLCLGRIAEIITEDLSRRANIPDTPGKLEALTAKGIITDYISRKISALTDTKSEAANEGYDSESACSRLMLTAEELCRWYINVKAGGRFGFLADLFPPDKPVPILMNISELGREAEENLYTNTRYCLICLGDMGEAIADRLISEYAIETHERDQIDRIDVLSDSGKITHEGSKILHSLRIARNKALHERYNDEYTSESEGRRLIYDALRLCEWLFMETVRPGYVVKARIIGENGAGYSAVIGRIPAEVPAGEVPRGKNVMAGKKYVFKVTDVDTDIISLSMTMAEGDYNLSMARLYAKYKPGQDVRVTVKSLSNSTGAVVELRDGLEARIPPSELGRKIYRYDDDHTKMVRFETVARVKWFSTKEYPPMLLSVKDVEEQPEIPPSVPEKRPAMSDLDFISFCKSAEYEQIIRAIDEGANPNAANRNHTTALMTAAQFNTNARAVKALIDAGADVGARNHRGNTALIYAAMRNDYDAVRVILEAGADIDMLNNDGKKAADYAVKNKRINGTDIVRLLRGETEEAADTLTEDSQPGLQPEEPQAESQMSQEESESETSQPESHAESQTPQGEPHNAPEQSQHEEYEDDTYSYEYGTDDTPKPTKEDEEEMTELRQKLQRDFLKICRSGSEDEIAEAVSAGVNVNVTNKSAATALMFAAQSNTAQAVEILIHAGAVLDAQDDSGNTALIYAASYNNDDVVDTLIDAGADRDITNHAGHRALEYARHNYRLTDTEALSRL